MAIKKSKPEDKISEQEQQFFLDEMADVRPLITEKRVQSIKKKTTTHPLHQQHSSNLEQRSDLEMMSDPIDLRDAEVGDVLFFARSGIQQKVQRKLRRGEFPIEDELDLHGYTVVEAKTAINEFFYDCKKQQKRYVRIIHGKGYRSEQKIPILKTHVAYWLPQHNDVMAFSSARPADGGTGALYVILKKIR
jgi:DNA-nicking Smr family endonuclease